MQHKLSWPTTSLYIVSGICGLCVLRVFGIHWVLPRSVFSAVKAWSHGGVGVSRSALYLLEDGPTCFNVDFMVGKEQRTFDGVESSGDQIKDRFIGFPFTWGNLTNIDYRMPFNTFLEHLSL